MAAVDSISQGRRRFLVGLLLFAVSLPFAERSKGANPAPQGTDFPLFMYEAGNPPASSAFVPYGWNNLQDYSAKDIPSINSFLQGCASINEEGAAIIQTSG